MVGLAASKGNSSMISKEYDEDDIDVELAEAGQESERDFIAMHQDAGYRKGYLHATRAWQRALYDAAVDQDVVRDYVASITRWARLPWVGRRDCFPAPKVPDLC